MKKTFPEGFYWGSATASYQVEGGIENTDWAEAARQGRVPECGAACEHYTRYEADFDLARELGHTAHRLSVEWARIEPVPGKFDSQAIAHYRQVLTALHDRGLKPYVTIWHFTLPLWFSEKGGFEQKNAPESSFAIECAQRHAHPVGAPVGRNESIEVADAAGEFFHVHRRTECLPWRSFFQRLHQFAVGYVPIAHFEIEVAASEFLIFVPDLRGGCTAHDCVPLDDV